MVRHRRHFAIKFAAGAMRVFAVVFPLFFILPALGVSTLTPAQGGAGPSFAFAGFFIVFGLVFGAIYGVILWGIADGLVLLADTFDAQQDTQQQIARLESALRPTTG